ncbi:MAG: hypothetical protein R3F59_15715 [Myxococcota bacterium]
MEVARGHAPVGPLAKDLLPDGAYHPQHEHQQGALSSLLNRFGARRRARCSSRARTACS